MITTLFLSFLFLIFALLIIILKPNLLFVLFALEIILLGVNINFIMASIVLDDFLGKFITLLLFSVAALDTAIGLILLMNYYGLHSSFTVNINFTQMLPRLGALLKLRTKLLTKASTSFEENQTYTDLETVFVSEQATTDKV